MTEPTAKAKQGQKRPEIRNPEFLRQLHSLGIIPQSLVRELLEELNGNALDLLTTLIQSGYGSKRKLCQIWCDSIGTAHVDLEKSLFQPDIVRKLSESDARQYYAIPIYQMGDTLTVATATPQDKNILKAIENRVSEPVNLVFALPQDIEWAIDQQYQDRRGLHEFLEKITASRALTENTRITEQHLRQTAGSDAVHQLHLALILRALENNATQIKISPGGQNAVVNFLQGRDRTRQYLLDTPVYETVVKNLAKLARLDENQEASRQYGRILFPTPGKKYDIGLSSFSAEAGRHIELTLMDPEPLARVPQLSELYMARTLQEFIAGQLAAAKGFLLLAGPDPRALVPMAYALLNESGIKPEKCLTIENAPRFLLKGVQQYQRNPRAGQDGKALLESCLNLQPQLLFIQSIDDEEGLAETLIRANPSETWIIAGIQAEDAFQALSRSRELGIQDLLTAVICHQPASRLCDHCKQEYDLPGETVAQLFVGVESEQVSAWRAIGCPYCAHSGFFGTIGVYEFLEIAPEFRQSAHTPMTRFDWHQAARRHNYESLNYDGIKKMLRGLISLEELARIQSRLPG